MFCDSNNTDNITAINDRRETVERELRSDPTLSLSPSLRSHHHDVRTSTVSYLNTICFYLLFQSTPLPNSCCVVTVQGAHTLYKQLFTHLSYLKWSSISRAVMNPRIISQVAVKHCVFLSSGITTHQAENKKNKKTKPRKAPCSRSCWSLGAEQTSGLFSAHTASTSASSVVIAVFLLTKKCWY